ncbi:MAG: hypothetical protein ACRC24_02550 [Vibrionaceae bacterium]
MPLLNQLALLDEQLIEHLVQEDVDADAVTALLAQRKAQMQKIETLASALPKDEWRLAIIRAERIFSLINQQRGVVLEKMRYVIKGRKSVILYKNVSS